MSTKKRPCGDAKAASFSTPDEARDFFHAWKGSAKYKMEVIEYKKMVEIPDSVLPDDHPVTILEKVIRNERRQTKTTATLWLSGKDIANFWSAATLKKHRDRLLKYGIDINKKPKKLLESQASLDDNEWHLSRPPQLKIMKTNG